MQPSVNRVIEFSSCQIENMIHNSIPKPRHVVPGQPINHFLCNPSCPFCSSNPLFCSLRLLISESLFVLRNLFCKLIIILISVYRAEGAFTIIQTEVDIISNGCSARFSTLQCGMGLLLKFALSSHAIQFPFPMPGLIRLQSKCITSDTLIHDSRGLWAPALPADPGMMLQMQIQLN